MQSTQCFLKYHNQFLMNIFPGLLVMTPINSHHRQRDRYRNDPDIAERKQAQQGVQKEASQKFSCWNWWRSPCLEVGIDKLDLH